MTFSITVTINIDMKKNKRMGRPPMKVCDRRSTITTLRLKPQARKRLENDAKDKEMSLSDYLYWCWQKARQ